MMLFLNGNHSELRSAVNTIGASVAIFVQGADKQFSIVTANELFSEIAEMDVSAMVGARLRELFPRYVEQPVYEKLCDCVTSQTSVEMELVIDRSGQHRWWRFIFSPVIGDHHHVTRVMATCIEITDKKQLEQSLENSKARFEAVVEAAYDGIISIDEQQKIVLMNRAACEIFATDKDAMMGKSLEQLIPYKHRKNHQQYVTSFGSSPISSRPMESRVAVRGLRTDGTEFPAEVTIAKINVGGNTEYTSVVRDISERARLIEELQKAATEDPLTKVSNRRFIEENLSREMERCRRFAHPVSLVMIDLDNFKEYNDTFGHSFGDEVLIKVTAFISERMREVDMLGRWGGDEFIVLLPETRMADATLWVDRLRREISNLTEQLSRPATNLDASFGIVESYGEESLDNLIERVDRAMYRDKSSVS